MEKEFLEWFTLNKDRFTHGQFDERQIAYSAWLEGRYGVRKNRHIVVRKMLEALEKW
jgi:hypothetical protein